MKKFTLWAVGSGYLAGCAHLRPSPAPPVLLAGSKQLSLKVNALKMGSDLVKTVSLSVGLPNNFLGSFDGILAVIP